MVMSPRTSRTINGLSATDGQPLAMPPALAAVPRFVTTAVPNNMVQGTSGATTSGVILGDFGEVFVGMRTEMRVSVLQERFAELGQVGFVLWLRADVAVPRPAAMARIVGVAP
jgi:HK97 family phage major capsid protein